LLTGASPISSSELKLPQKVQDIVIGCLLGDASAERRVTLWGYTTALIPISKSTLDGKGGIHYFFTFRTKTSSLAYWISEDGAYTGAGILIHTNCFTREEVELLISVIEKNFGIKSNIRANYDNWIIILLQKR
ncbi:13079_t:CDS:2, partial [Funneliformis caledonium]